MNALNKLNELKQRTFFENDDELFTLFDSLPEMPVEEMIGKWQGGDFKSGHWDVGALQNMNWFGKWFKSPLDVYPLVCRNEEGKLFSNKIMKGEASLWNIEFRGKVSATMVYDGVPIFDHFRKVDDNTVMGVMNGKEFEGDFPNIIDNGRYYFFYLERLQDYPLEFVGN